mmetsp:Transcript_13473/g.20862  ORF Transcript_13473/g.20862 Transcript_13473/m.20862 type:complete len:117 (+) Transcript_13473:892-1242(+)
MIDSSGHFLQELSITRLNGGKASSCGGFHNLIVGSGKLAATMRCICIINDVGFCCCCCYTFGTTTNAADPGDVVGLMQRIDSAGVTIEPKDCKEEQRKVFSLSHCSVASELNKEDE